MLISPRRKTSQTVYKDVFIGSGDDRSRCGISQANYTKAGLDAIYSWMLGTSYHICEHIKLTGPMATKKEDRYSRSSLKF